MRKFAALVTALILTFSSLAGGQGASEEYAAHCKDLQDRMVTAKTRMIEGVLPQEDPSRFLSSMSCLDSILSMQFNFGVFFSIDWIINKLMEMITNRVCGNAAGRWNETVSWVNNQVGINVELPWGVRATDPAKPIDYGPKPEAGTLPYEECTASGMQPARDGAGYFYRTPDKWVGNGYVGASGWNSIDQLRLEPGEIATYDVIAPQALHSAVVVMMQGQQPATPPGVWTEMSVSRCPGVIDNTVPQCFMRSSMYTYNHSPSIYREPFLLNGKVIDSQEKLGDRGCWAPMSQGRWYLNIRWIFPSCPYGTRACGFSMQWNIGSNW